MKTGAHTSGGSGLLYRGPYVYCDADPVNIVDPEGMWIEESSRTEWNDNKKNVEQERDEVIKTISLLTSKGKTSGLRFKWLQERLNGLSETLETISLLESTTQGYRLNNIGGTTGGVCLNGTMIDINYTGSTSNFVHEITHGGQFERGDFAFIISSGSPIAHDIFDEVAAYKAQFIYEGESPSVVTPEWVAGLFPPRYPYARGGEFNTGWLPVNIYSSYSSVMKSHDKESVGSSAPLYLFPGIYYKKN